MRLRFYEDRRAEGMNVNVRTEGPWIYHATAGNHDYEVYSEQTGRTVALVRNFNKDNARLIAEAPAMLECLQDVQANLTGKDYRAERIADALRRVNAMLARLGDCES